MLITIIITEIQAALEVYTFNLDRATVFAGIGSFGKTLKELFIDGPCTHYFSLTSLLGLLPALTHLMIKRTYLDDDNPFPDDESINGQNQQNIQSDNDDDNSNDEMYNLVFLYLDSSFRPKFHIKQIVKRCHRLKYLLASTLVLMENEGSASIDFASVLELCPSIQYVRWGGHIVEKRTQKEWLTLSRREKRHTDNENTSDSKKVGANDLRRVGLCSNIEGQHISTLKACFQQPSSLKHLRLFGLFKISLYRLWNSFTYRNRNLLSQFPKIKSLELERFCIPHHIENDIFFENLFSPFQHIILLKMGLYVTRVGNVDEERNSVSKIFEAIGHQLHQLQCLYLHLAGLKKLVTRMVLRDNLFTTLCAGNRELRLLHLCNVPISNDMLLDLCDHPKLHTLSLSGYHLHKQLTKDGWVSFARKRKEQDQTNNGRIRSIWLTRCYHGGVTDEVLEEFAGIKSLETLVVTCNKDITDSGVNKFESIRSISSKNHKKIELWDCINVSLDNPNAVFVHPHF